MPRFFEGKRSGKGLRFGIVVSRFNHEVTEKLLEGALDGLESCGVSDSDVDVARVPGAFEIPATAKRMARTGKYSAVICLGAVIKGETAHWEHISSAASHALAHASAETGVPLAFGILTTETEELALARCGAKEENKGYDAALAAVEMARLFAEME